ncbi:ethanolamine ammonia-lyase reactivating factor EutA [Neobacillus sp. LXY-1]|uniref:ethanolamine ammonia-lyase reactivating factor EutA n=1 Tax=Neobacillus sp. LXY-1 TaxID=3379133 RepID=UPI003EE1114F
MDTEIIKSVGIDIGTSTTKMIMSELTLGRVSSHFALPHYDIVERKVTYVSEIISTPLKNHEEIDLFPLMNWLEKEYNNAGMLLADIKTGAVIITGESAIKKNADALIHYLAERSGDFVVAVAGASLEAVLAGRGSGAFDFSQKHKEVVGNIDIGGGTANVVIIQQGKILETITFHVGGRLIEINALGEIIAVSPSLKPWLTSKNYIINKGMKITLEELSEIVYTLCFDMLDILCGLKGIDSHEPLILSTSNVTLPSIKTVMISGGVGKLLEEAPPISLAEVARYNDIGPILAREFLKALKNYPLSLQKATQTSRATVIGAGMQTTRISGSTISIQPNRLPLRNIPVMKIVLLEDFEQQLKTVFLQGRELYGGQNEVPFAISISGPTYFSYKTLKKLAEAIGTLYPQWFPDATILAVVCETDIAKALGQALRLHTSSSNLGVICIDQIVVEHGDYIDIGETLHDSMVPVVVKTLAFSK